MSIRKTMIAAVLVIVAQTAWAANVTGTWNMTVETQSGSGNPVFILKQTGDKVAGTYKGQMGEVPVTGTVKGNELALTYKMEVQGTAFEVKYTGTVDGKNVSGKVSLGKMGEGTFKGTKAP